MGDRGYGRQGLWETGTLRDRGDGRQGLWESGTMGNRSYGKQEIWETGAIVEEKGAIGYRGEDIDIQGHMMI